MYRFICYQIILLLFIKLIQNRLEPIYIFEANAIFLIFKYELSKSNSFIKIQMNQQKQTTLFQTQISLLQIESPSLGAYSKQDKDLFPESETLKLIESLNGKGNKRIKYLGNNQNSILKGFYFYCLYSMFIQKNIQLQEKFKRLFYSSEICLTNIDKIPDQYKNIENQAFKKLVVQFFHIITYSSDNDKIQKFLNKYSIIDIALILFMRSLLVLDNVKSAAVWDQNIQWQKSFKILCHKLEIYCKIVKKFKYCEFSNSNFWLFEQNANIYAVYFDQRSSQLPIDHFDIESMAQSISEERNDKSDEGTPKFKHLFSYKKKQHKNSFGGESLAQINKQPISPLLRKSSACIENDEKYIQKNISEKDQSQKNDKEKIIQVLEIEDSKGNLVDLKVPLKENKNTKVFSWDERSSFSQFAGLRAHQILKQKASQILDTKNKQLQDSIPPEQNKLQEQQKSIKQLQQLELESQKNSWSEKLCSKEHSLKKVISHSQLSQIMDPQQLLTQTSKHIINKIDMGEIQPIKQIDTKQQNIEDNIPIIEKNSKITTRQIQENISIISKPNKSINIISQQQTRTLKQIFKIKINYIDKCRSSQSSNSVFDNISQNHSIFQVPNLLVINRTESSQNLKWNKNRRILYSMNKDVQFKPLSSMNIKKQETLTPSSFTPNFIKAQNYYKNFSQMKNQSNRLNFQTPSYNNKRKNPHITFSRGTIIRYNSPQTVEIQTYNFTKSNRKLQQAINQKSKSPMGARIQLKH